jgi:3',5'-cyclic AMP phosphodiesterase CpdA
MRLAHLSDLHFGHHDEALAATLAPQLNAQKLDLVVISGDFTQDGTEDEFIVARRFIDQLEAPVFAVPGNHDVPQRNMWRRLIAPYSLYRRYISDELEPFLEIDGVALAGLRTVRRFTPDMNWSNGFLDSDQLVDLGPRFALASEDAVRVVVAHHPLLYPEGPAIKQRRVRRANRALRAFSSFGVRLILSGHFHLSYVRVHEHPGTNRIGSPDGLRRASVAPILVAQTSSTISTRLRGHPNAYNLIEIVDGNIEIDVCIWDGKDWTVRQREIAEAGSTEVVET